MDAANQCLLIRHSRRGSAALQVDPLVRSRRLLLRNGWQLQLVDAPGAGDALEAVRRHGSGRGFDAILLQVDWREPVTGVVELIQRIRNEPSARRCRIGFLDHYDGVTSPHFEVLPHVDAYVKKQLPQRLGDLSIAPAGGGRIAEYFRELYDQPAAPADAAEEQTDRVISQYGSRLQLGWNVGAGDFIFRRMFRNRLLTPLLGSQKRLVPYQNRSIDIHCRVGLGSHGFEDWYRRHRRAVVGRLEQLKGPWTMAVGMSGAKVGPGVPARQYERELRNTRICVSPFGYGEICYRDFEAVAAGCLLAKPDMGHVRTQPNIYIPHETYIPFRWDLADIGEALEPYLADPERARAVAANAREVLAGYFRQQAWAGPFLRAVSAIRAPAWQGSPTAVPGYSRPGDGATIWA